MVKYSHFPVLGASPRALGPYVLLGGMCSVEIRSNGLEAAPVWAWPEPTLSLEVSPHSGPTVACFPARLTPLAVPAAGWPAGPGYCQ